MWSRILKTVILLLGLCLTITWAFLCAFFGLLLMLTIFLMPFGLACFPAAVLPTLMLVRWYIKP